MLSHVLIQPDNNRDDLQKDAQEAWHAFEIAIANHPLVNVPIRSGLASNER
jgi:hypothetical protein